MRSFKKGPTQICSVFGPTCDALDTISLAAQLPDMEMGDLVYSENIGAYSAASSTSFQWLSAGQSRAREPVDASAVSRLACHAVRRYAASLQLLHQNFRVPSALVVFLAARRRKVVGRTFGKAALRLEVGKRLRR